MELVDYGTPDEALEWFEIPSRPGAKIGGPTDLNRKQAKELGKMVTGKDVGDDFTRFTEVVFIYWASLPSARWNLAKRKDDASPLEPMPLNQKTILEELRNSDVSVVSLEVTKFLFPHMFTEIENMTKEEKKDDLMEGLEMAPEMPESPAAEMEKSQRKRKDAA